MLEYSKGNIRLWSRLGSCGAFGAAAMELAQTNDKALMITSDLCFYSGLDRFKAQYPDKIYNCGIAEQNMIGIAAGMAKEGFVPFATTYATFASTRCADQVRVNMGYMKLNMKLIGLTSGLSVGILGATHVSIEDIAIMRSIPNIIILSPADATESIKACLAAAETNEPVYIRLSGPMNNPIVYNEDYDFKIGKAEKIVESQKSEISIIATGTMVHTAMKAAEIIKEQNGIDVDVINMHTIKPLDTDMIDSCLSSKMIVTVEEHSVIGGLGSAVSEYLSDKTVRPPQQIIGIEDRFPHAGEYDFLIESYGLKKEQIAQNIMDKFNSINK